MNTLYAVDFFVQLINLYSYYQVHDVSVISDRYMYTIVSWAITFILILLIINEERYAPSEDIIADTVSKRK